MNFTNPDAAILKRKKLFIFDMDGTIYLGDIPLDRATDFMTHLHENGHKILFLTNNASHTTEFYMDKLSRLGFNPLENEIEIMTSGEITIEFLTRYRAGKSVYVLGTDELVENFRKSGISVVDDDAESADIVVTSIVLSLTQEKLDTACRFVNGGAEYFSTHPDMQCPTDTGFIPDSGAIAKMVTEATGVTPTFFGKPYRETMERIIKATGISTDDMCIFGDRLSTDIALGKNFGATAVLVLTGEAQLGDVEVADETEKPDFVFNSIADADELLFG
ncbi:MAG: HAD-IIA family hydrolase [Clostridia bacterium]|nr:HAD-IIA family hydrolase [Clostridia bacterium]